MIAAELRARYMRHFGLDYWSLDVPGWRLIAINAQLLGSDLAPAGDQLRFVHDAAAGAKGRAVVLFVHKPLFDVSADEDAITGRFVNPRPRRQLLDALGGCRLELVASGHVHQFRSHRPHGTHHVWAPSTGFILPDARQPLYGLSRRATSSITCIPTAATSPSWSPCRGSIRSASPTSPPPTPSTRQQAEGHALHKQS